MRPRARALDTPSLFLPPPPGRCLIRGCQCGVMADIKTGIFAKNVQKRLNRAQEKVLQKLGKADETKDEQFEQVVVNFRRQEGEGSRLQREMKAYMAAIKGMQQASINLTQSLHEVYEPDWHGRDDVMTIGKDCDALWENFHNKLVDSTLLNLDAYLLQFPELKNRVAKRSRKLIDYDSARHHVETLQTSGMKNDRKMLKADEELRKAQRVFDELNVGLQDELPTLWDSRVSFYISTFRSVSSLEARFHREISLVCKQLYEVMMQLSEQHADKMFTIQGAPSDSGPLRLARTPSPPEDESPPESPDAASNHTLRPVSPGPPLRPKSPAQGPPVPPPPKATPSKEVAEEQIIDLFGGEFLPAPSPSQPNERPGESLLDLDFDAFQPDESVSPLPQTAVPWDTWSAQPAQTDSESGFVADWSADFASAATNGEAGAGEGAAGAPSGVEGGDGGGRGDEATPPPAPEDSEAAGDEVSGRDRPSQSHPDLLYGVADQLEEGQAELGAGEGGRRKSTPGLIVTNEFGERIEDGSERATDQRSGSPDGSGSEYESAEEWAGEAQRSRDRRPDAERSVNDEQKTDVTSADAESKDLRPGMEADSDPFAGTQKGGQGGFASPPFAEMQGGGTFDLDPFAHVEEGGGLGSDPFAESREGEGTFDWDPFVGLQRGGAFDSDPFAESREGVFNSDPFADLQGRGAFDSDPFAEAPDGGAFSSDPFAQTRHGDSFDGVVVFAGDDADRLKSEASLESEGPVVSGDVGSGRGPFANSLCAASADGVSDGDVSREQVGKLEPPNEGGRSSTQDQGVNVPKEAESCDPCEDEAAELSFGKMYRQDVAKGKEEDSTGPSFFADFDQINKKEVKPESAEASEMPDAGEEVPQASLADEEEPSLVPPAAEENTAAESCAPPLEENPAESMAIPSVVIEPASSNEGDDDRDADIVSPAAISDNCVAAVADKDPVKGAPGELPDHFLYKVETMHDFEAANSDELDLKQGDVVLVVPTASLEDQEAGWLTGFKQSDWMTLGTAAQKGLFPQNFTQRLE
ncbi:amphiphysin isoform X2 [Festucalex cinctus]